MIFALALTLVSLTAAQYENYQQPKIPLPPVMPPPQDPPADSYNPPVIPPQDPVTPPPAPPPQTACGSCKPIQMHFNTNFMQLFEQAKCDSLGLNLDDYEVLSAERFDSSYNGICQETIRCSDYADTTVWIGIYEGQLGCHNDQVFKYQVTCRNGNFIDHEGDNMIALLCLKKAEKVQPPPPQDPPRTTCGSCQEVQTNFSPSLIQEANCDTLGIDLSQYEILSAMRIDTSYNGQCSQTIKCSDYATKSIWIGNYQDKFSCHDDEVFEYHTTCENGLMIDHERDHMVALVCLRKIQTTPLPPPPPPQDKPAPPPRYPYQRANGYSGY